jgi:pimeloyl-ACP methyl ester carboxylesterase
VRRDFKGYFRDLSPLFAKDSDPAIRHWVEEQAQASAPLILVPEPGHFLPLERPGEFNQALDKWIPQLTAGLR